MYERLLSPMKIGSMTVKNRTVMTAAEFKAAWRKMDVEDNSQGQPAVAKDSADQSSTGDSSKLPLAVAVIIVIAALLVVLRKRKK